MAVIQLPVDFNLGGVFNTVHGDPPGVTVGSPYTFTLNLLPGNPDLTPENEIGVHAGWTGSGTLNGQPFSGLFDTVFVNFDNGTPDVLGIGSSGQVTGLPDGSYLSFTFQDATGTAFGNAYTLESVLTKILQQPGSFEMFSGYHVGANDAFGSIDRFGTSPTAVPEPASSGVLLGATVLLLAAAHRLKGGHTASAAPAQPASNNAPSAGI